MAGQPRHAGRPSAPPARCAPMARTQREGIGARHRMARSISRTPPGTDVVRIGGHYYPVLLRDGEEGPGAIEYIMRDDDGSTPVCYTRRIGAVEYLWRRERWRVRLGTGTGASA